jgi:prepilin-type N-terminal cleavage/methylation domain-containing protein
MMTLTPTPSYSPQTLQHRQRGFSLVELSIVIAVGLLMILLGLKFGPSLFRGAKVNGEVQNVTMLISNLSNTYQGRFANLTVANALNLNAVPGDLRDGAAITGKWGAITLAPAALTGGNPNTAMQVTLANIPQEVCTTLAPALLGAADEMDVGGNANVKTQANPNPATDIVAGNCGPAGGPAVPIVLRKS